MRIIKNYDVASYYPHLMTLYNYTSRSIPSPKVFSDVLDTRMKAKAEGDKTTANALKLVVNTTYGAMLNQYNALFDPLKGRSVCISGQLFLLELAEHLYSDIPELRIVQLNTDGIMIEFDNQCCDRVSEIVTEWQERTGFELEEDSIIKICQKDVNNYIEVQSNNDVKSKGGYLVRGIAPAGAFNINNNAIVVATALKEYFLRNIPVSETINNCNDLSQFQIIAKAGVKYKEAYHVVDGEKQPVQRVNRVYATKDERYGKLFKIKVEDDDSQSEAKIASLPEHCIIDNDNHLTISDIDKSFYVEMAEKKINDFKGIIPEKPKKRRAKKMAAENVYQKLQTARLKFLENGVQKTGKNTGIKFMYFELEDIVPSVTKIFSEVGLISKVSFTGDVASITIINTDKGADSITFEAPFMVMKPINNAMNDIQALGASITYMRRYLYMMAMDIVEADAIDSTESAPKTTKPPTTEERQAIKDSLTASNEKATDIQITSLKKVLAELKTAQPDKENLVREVIIKTNSFKNINKAECEALIQKFTSMLSTKEKTGD